MLWECMGSCSVLVVERMNLGDQEALGGPLQQDNEACDSDSTHSNQGAAEFSDDTESALPEQLDSGTESDPEQLLLSRRHQPSTSRSCVRPRNKQGRASTVEQDDSDITVSRRPEAAHAKRKRSTTKMVTPSQVVKPNLQDLPNSPTQIALPQPSISDAPTVSSEEPDQVVTITVTDDTDQTDPDEDRLRPQVIADAKLPASGREPVGLILDRSHVFSWTDLSPVVRLMRDATLHIPKPRHHQPVLSPTEGGKSLKWDNNVCHLQQGVFEPLFAALVDTDTLTEVACELLCSPQGSLTWLLGQALCVRADAKAKRRDRPLSDLWTQAASLGLAKEVGREDNPFTWINLLRAPAFAGDLLSRMCSWQVTSPRWTCVQPHCPRNSGPVTTTVTTLVRSEGRLRHSATATQLGSQLERTLFNLTRPWHGHETATRNVECDLMWSASDGSVVECDGFVIRTDHTEDHLQISSVPRIVFVHIAPTTRPTIDLEDPIVVRLPDSGAAV